MQNSPSLETYLAQIARELRALPPQARADELREIEAHLAALVLASQQLENLGAEAATATALRQFGAPRSIGRKLRKAWERKQPEAWWRVVLAPALALTIRAVFTLIFSGLTHFYLTSHGYYATTGSSNGIILNQQVAILENLMNYQYIATAFTAITISYVMGLISPKRGVTLACLYATFSVTKDFFLFSHLGSPELMTIFANGATIVFVFTATGAYLGSHHGRTRQVRLAK